MKVNSKKKKKKIDISISFRYMIPGIVALILLVVIFLETDFVPKQALGSIYNINDLETNFDNVQIGDTVNYEINGYSDWQVIGKDEYKGTVDVVSKTNTENLTLEFSQSKEYYENIFQETANKYTDNSHAVNARIVSPEDLELFSYEEDFVTGTIIDNKIIKTSKTEWEINPNHKIYVIPYIKYSTHGSYVKGNTIDYSVGGVDRWIVASEGRYEYDYPYSWYIYTLIPETPIELVINSVDDDVNEKYNQIMEPFINKEGGLYTNNREILEYLSSFFSQQTEKILFISSCEYSKNNNRIVSNCGSLPSYENGEITYTSNSVIYKDTSIPEALGFRPIVTLKVKDEVQDKDKKEISDEIKVGDNVKYEANGYNNWKVISTDKEDNTADIISGGIVKNLTLSGKDDWDNYEKIIQNEVDEYKSGDNTKATTISTSDLDTLRQIDHSTLPRYWVLTKNTHIKQSYSSSTGGRADLVYYNIGSINIYKYDNYDLYIDNVTIYADFKGDSDVAAYYDHYKNSVNSLSYTAGLRPVIKMRLNDIEKLSNREKKKVEEESARLNKVLESEQSNKNKNYKGSIKKNDSTNYTGNSDTTSSDDSKSNTNNKNIRP